MVINCEILKQVLGDDVEIVTSACDETKHLVNLLDWLTFQLHLIACCQFIIKREFIK